jgi:phytoene dehydrogenase-like protein
MEGNIHTVVIGAGVAGMAAASELAEKGHHVLVL